VTVIAKSAAVADALSTAFYVMSLEEIQGFCENRPGVGAIIIPLPTNDRRVRPHVFGVDLAELYWDKEQIRV
jgi:thiamine biosynthesis lipoprotein